MQDGAGAATASKKKKRDDKARFDALKKAQFDGAAAAALAAAAAVPTDAASAYEMLEFKDQGFTRAKVLVLLPYRHSALEFVRTMVKMFGFKVSAQLPETSLCVVCA